MTDHIQNDPMRLQHKSLGIASFVTAIVGVLLFVAAGVWLLRNPFPIFLDDFGWLGAIGLVGIGLEWRSRNGLRQPSRLGGRRRDRAGNARGRNLGSIPLLTWSAHETG